MMLRKLSIVCLVFSMANLLGHVGAEDEDVGLLRRIGQGRFVTLLNRGLEKLVPVINDAVQDILIEDYEPYELGLSSTESIGEIALLNNLCVAGVDFSYALGLLSGLSFLMVDTIRMIPGSEVFEGGILDTGRKFGADFEMFTSMKDNRTLVGSFGGGVEAMLCGIKLAQNMYGSAGVYGAQGKLTLKLGGLISLNEGVEFDDAVVEDADMTYNTMQLELDEDFVSEGNSTDQGILDGAGVSYIKNVVGSTSEAPLNAALNPIIEDVAIKVLGNIFPIKIDLTGD